MHDVLVVHVVQGQTQLLDDVGSLAFLKHTHALDLIKQITTCDELHDDVVTSLVFKKLEYSGDMWMHSVLKNSELVPVQFLVNIGNQQTALADDLDSARYLRLFMLTKLYGTECTSTQLSRHDVVV